MRYSFIITICFSVICFLGCEPAEVDYSQLTRGNGVSVETAFDVEILYSDSSKLKVKVTGPVSKRYTKGYTVEEEFPDGVHVEFYDPQGEVMSWLDADYAIRKESEKKIIAQGNVILRNVKDEKLEGPEVIWDERTREIYSDRFVKITRGKEIIYSHSFRSDEGFNEMKLKAIEGDMILEELNTLEN